jgi:PIN domain nuclease of toxin-antitoxin system
MLIAQAIHEGLTLVSSDQTVAKYAAPTLWE